MFVISNSSGSGSRVCPSPWPIRMWKWNNMLYTIPKKLCCVHIDNMKDGAIHFVQFITLGYRPTIEWNFEQVISSYHLLVPSIWHWHKLIYYTKYIWYLIRCWLNEWKIIISPNVYRPARVCFNSIHAIHLLSNSVCNCRWREIVVAIGKSHSMGWKLSASQAHHVDVHLLRA